VSSTIIPRTTLFHQEIKGFSKIPRTTYV